MLMTSTTVSKEDLKEREREFSEALARWRSNKLQKDWDTMYYRVYDCCHNISAKMLRGVRTDPEKFDDRVLDSTLYVLERILKGTNPQKLSSYCYLVCKGRLFGPKQQFEDRKIQYVPELFQYLEKEVCEEDVEGSEIL